MTQPRQACEQAVVRRVPEDHPLHPVARPHDVPEWPGGLHRTPAYVPAQGLDVASDRLLRIASCSQKDEDADEHRPAGNLDEPATQPAARLNSFLTRRR